MEYKLALCDCTCWFSSRISASLPPFLDKDGFFLMAGMWCWTRCGVGMFLGTVGDVRCGPGVTRDSGGGGRDSSAFLSKPVRSQHLSSTAVVATGRARSRAAWCAFDLSHYGKQFSPFSRWHRRSKLWAFNSTVRQLRALKSQRQNMPTRRATVLKISAVMVLPISTHTARGWQSYKAGFWHTAAPWRLFPMAFK